MWPKLLLLLLVAAAQACSAQHCDRDVDKRQSDACDPECPLDPDAAILEICAHPDSSGTWEEGPNKCGGWTVRSARESEGIQYDFTADRQFLCVSIWSRETMCRTRSTFGKDACDQGGSFITKHCVYGDDAGRATD
jgi:hypothetical protein